MTDYITTEEFAQLARTNAATVRYWRHIGNGPAGFKLGRRVLYSETEIRSWIEEVRTAQAGGPE